MQSPNIKEARALKDYLILITFVNDKKRIFDLKPYLKYPVFQPLKDHNEFLCFIIEDGTIEWKCGADLSPDTFYLESTDCSELMPAPMVPVTNLSTYGIFSILPWGF